MQSHPDILDLAVIGGGAAGLAAAIFTGRHGSGRRIAVLDGAKKLGAKILVSGGGRCNVTNAVVTADDFAGCSRHLIKRVLAALPVDRTISFFREIGVSLHEEENGKLFPDTNQARTVLDALTGEASRVDIRLLTNHRVQSVKLYDLTPQAEADSKDKVGFEIETSAGILHSHCIVLATGGRSLPKTGSDGGGYRVAQSLGHTLIPTTPALAPLILDGQFHKPLSGLTHPVELTIAVPSEKPLRLSGSMLWTHFGVSGPAPMNASRHWHRARLEGKPVTIHANLLPGHDLPSAERRLLEIAAAQPKSQLHNALALMLPARLADAVLPPLGIRPQVQMSQLAREDRRKLHSALLAWPLPVRDSRGYDFAEATAGGVPLDEIDAATMQSRQCPGLYLVGEILDVDGRIGGFNFQWAWCTGFIAARAIASRMAG